MTMARTTKLPGVQNADLGLCVWLEGRTAKVLARPGALPEELGWRLTEHQAGEWIRFGDGGVVDERFNYYVVPVGDPVWIDCCKYASRPDSTSA